MATEFAKQLGNRIRHFRKLNGFTQEELSEKIGVENSTLGHIEIGKNLPSTSRLPIIAEAMNVSVYELFIEKEIDPNVDKIDAINKILKSLDKKQLNLLYDLIFNLFDLCNK